MSRGTPPRRPRARAVVACAVGLILSPMRLVFAQAAGLRELVLVDGVLPDAQRLIKATKGESLRWRFISNRAGEVHLHAYRLSLVLQPGQPAELAFKAHATGRFRIEWHEAGGTAAAGGHHAPPLAVLEVRPP